MTGAAEGVETDGCCDCTDAIGGQAISRVRQLIVVWFTPAAPVWWESTAREIAGATREIPEVVERAVGEACCHAFSKSMKPVSPSASVRGVLSVPVVSYVHILPSGDILTCSTGFCGVIMTEDFILIDSV